MPLARAIPDLYVYVSANPAPRTSAELHDSGAFEVAALNGHVGDQNYALPADLKLDGFKSVVIYCRRFSLVFSSAALATEVSNP
jgi:Electron transfer DM13